MKTPRQSARRPSLTSSDALLGAIREKQSFLCVGLDPDPAQIPACFGTGVAAMEAFCKAVVEVTLPYAVAYKPNLAFFEQYGAEGWAAMERVVDHIPSNVLCIADAKRGDIGNTAARYAKALFWGLGADAVTVAPYMGRDSVEPFTSFADRWTILLALTSNPSADDFELQGSPPLYERVLAMSKTFEGSDRLMYVVGATRPESLARVRELVPDAFLLVPGVGAQGGTVEAVAKHGMNDRVGLLVNSSRGILQAGNQEETMDEVLEQVALAAERLAGEMRALLEARGWGV
ncbi:MAG: orotidine-5'-phosphate decarboxylase [Bacteroidetes bacterium]|nr:orotidine-5'-phosphate decarboxylase [Bacteroidota bacterium]MDA0902893.1 orotidine-5'-phosphate decarboxylase [Bacteroidota bacterium]MDA1241954.1 orotidine-5'-phosphate decarboxylase [Bacteroidota bacterium]